MCGGCGSRRRGIRQSVRWCAGRQLRSMRVPVSRASISPFRAVSCDTHAWPWPPVATHLPPRCAKTCFQMQNNALHRET
ncbi:hypothetical protein ABIC49_006280 [Burkholderia ambifaria]